MHPPSGELAYDARLTLTMPGTLDERIVIADNRVSTLILHRGEQGSFKYLSAADVIQGKVDPADLKGKIVLVGAQVTR